LGDTPAGNAGIVVVVGVVVVNVFVFSFPVDVVSHCDVKLKPHFNA
jgi:hypothetical protein